MWSDYDFTSAYPNWVVSNGSWLSATDYPKAAEHIAADISGLEIESEVVESENTSGVSYTVYYYSAGDGHKVVPSVYNDIDQSAVLNSMYDDNGTAWYYCRDMDTGAFMLPRASGAERRIVPKNAVVPVYGNGMAIGFVGKNSNGETVNAGSLFLSNVCTRFTFTQTAYGSNVGEYTDDNLPLYKHGTTIGITNDSSKSGMVADVRQILTENTVLSRRLMFFVS